MSWGSTTDFAWLFLNTRLFLSFKHGLGISTVPLWPCPLNTYRARLMGVKAGASLSPKEFGVLSESQRSSFARVHAVPAYTYCCAAALLIGYIVQQKTPIHFVLWWCHVERGLDNDKHQGKEAPRRNNIIGRQH
eukprot:1194369-Prorocentrum_minimum.AAC.8